MRAFSMALAFCLCALTGIRSARKLYSRCTELTELRASLRALRTEIAFGNTRLSDAVSRLSKRGVFGVFALELAGCGNPGDAWRRAEKAFSADEATVLATRRFFDSLGRGNMAALDREFELIDSELSNAAEEAVKKAKNGGKLRSTLGVLTGVAAVILMM